MDITESDVERLENEMRAKSEADTTTSSPIIDKKETETQKSEEIKSVPVIVTVSEKGYLEAADFSGRWKMAAAFFTSGMVPKSYKSIAAVFAGLEFAAQLGLKPLIGLRQIAVVNGQPSTWGELPLGLCKRTGELESIEEFVFTAAYDKICFENKNLTVPFFGALCRVKRKGNELVERWFTMEDAKLAGLLSKDTPWKTYPRRMIQMRARSHALKDAFADTMAGVPIAEYDYNYLPDARDVTENPHVSREGERSLDAAAEINKTLDDVPKKSH